MRKFGLIGYPLTHSFSQRYFSEKFEKEKIEQCSYSNYPLQEIGGILTVLDDVEVCGLNVTIPYKQLVIGYLHEKNEVVEEIHACNCIKIIKGRLYGYNTDVIGFEQSLKKKLKPSHKEALILGTGGSSKAVEYVLRKNKIHYRLVSRRPDASAGQIGYEAIDADILSRTTLIINTTPVGMYPKVDDCPALPYQALTPNHYLFDLVYNPAETLFLQKGRSQGAAVENGHEMLLLQAEESWRIWNS